MSKNRPKLLLVDGSSYLFRAYHKLPPLTGPNNQPTGAAYGVINMLNKLVRDEQPDRLGVVFDGKGKNFRHEAYSEYKAQRPSMPTDLATQIPLIFDIIEALGYRRIHPPNTEADDVLATLARQGEKSGFNVLISTGDKDLAQLVNKRIELINTMEKDTRKARMDEQGVVNKFGVAPNQIVDYLALVGDTADNIPGVPGVGPKTACGWLAQYGSLKEIEARADEIKGKRGEDLRASIERFPLLINLVTLRDDIDLDVTPDELTMSAPQTKKLATIYREYGFYKWLEALEGLGKPDTLDLVASAEDARDASDAEQDATPAAATAITDDAALQTWLNKLRAAKLVAIDAFIDESDSTLAGLALSTDDAEAAYIPLAHTDGSSQMKAAEVLKALRQVLADATPQKLGCGLKQVRLALAQHGVALNGIAHDVALASYVHNSVAVRHTLHAVAAKYLNAPVRAPEDVIGKGARKVTFASLAPEVVAQYAAERLAAVWRAHRFFEEAMRERKQQAEIYRNIEIPLASILADMEKAGVMVDVSQVSDYNTELTAQIRDLESEIYAAAGREFNIASPKQLGEVLFNELNLPISGKTSTGKVSTNESVLKELASAHVVPKMILDYRFISKLKSTYLESLLAMADDAGRVHTTFHQNVTATGRLSSSDPNLQNIPIRTEAGRRLRRCFIAPPKRRLIAADYSQIELRIMAHLSQDEALRGAFERGEDIHVATAAEIFGVSKSEVSSDQRRQAKAINFGLIYGMTPFGLAKQIEISQQDAKAYYDAYFARYRRVQDLIERTRSEARERGYVETVLGRRLYIAGIHAPNAMQRRAAERTAINAPMQGTAADLIKLAMIELRQRMSEAKANATLILQVHDELIVEVDASEADDMMAMCVNCMESINRLDVPLVVDARVGDNWEEAH